MVDVAAGVVPGIKLKRKSKILFGLVKRCFHFERLEREPIERAVFKPSQESEQIELNAAASKNSPAFRTFGTRKRPLKYPKSLKPRLFQKSRNRFARCIDPSLAVTKLTQRMEQGQAPPQII